MMKYLLAALLISSVAAADKLRETEWSQILATNEIGGETEAKLPDSTRVDILTDRIAYEVEWASKWKEAIGQALYYSASTNRQPGILLLSSGSAKDKVSYLRLMTVATKYNITVLVVKIDKKNNYEIVTETRAGF